MVVRPKIRFQNVQFFLVSFNQNKNIRTYFYKNNIFYQYIVTYTRRVLRLFPGLQKDKKKRCGLTR